QVVAPAQAGPGLAAVRLGRPSVLHALSVLGADVAAVRHGPDRGGPDGEPRADSRLRARLDRHDGRYLLVPPAAFRRIPRGGAVAVRVHPDLLAVRPQ